MNLRHVQAALGVGLILLTACNQKDRPASTSSASPGTNQVFQVKGIVQQVKPAEKLLVIKHEKIPDYMEAMTMPFVVKNPAEMKGLQKGDSIGFRFTVTS